MSPQTFAYIGSAIGALGGVAGLVAFWWQASDRLKARSLRHFPPALREQVERSLVVGKFLVDHDVDDSYASTTLRPLELDLERSRATMNAASLSVAGTGDLTNLQMLHMLVGTSATLARATEHLPLSVRDLQNQQARGQQIQMYATRLLRRGPAPS